MTPRPAAAVPGQPAEHALLGLLSLAGGAAHGYDLARQFRRGQPLGDVLRLEPAMLYKHLKKLAGLGWVSLSLVDQAPRPPRQLCRLTAAGEEELRRWLAEPVVRTREVRLEFLIKLYFAWRLDPTITERLVRKQREVVMHLIESLAQQLATLSQPGQPVLRADDRDAVFRQLVLELRLQQTQAAASWLEHAANVLGSPSMSGETIGKKGSVGESAIPRPATG